MSNFICVIVLILFPVTCIENLRRQFLSRLHSIITSQWLKLVSCCFLMVKLQLKIILTRMWNVTSLAGKELELVCEMKQYQLDIVGLTSIHSVGSGTKLLERG